MAGNDSFTKSLLHFEGAAGSTVFPDENAGGAAKTWTPNGTVQLTTTTVEPFGASSLHVNGAGNWIYTPAHTDFDVGSGNFTVDFWFYVLGGEGGTRGIYGSSSSAFAASSSTVSFNLNGQNKMVFTAYQGTNKVEIISTNVFTVASAVWRHCEGCRDGSTLRLFINGTQDGTVAITGAVNNTSTKPSIGRLGEFNNFYWNGLIKEFRFSKGITRHTANFTPPTEAYSPDFVPLPLQFNMPMLGI